MQIEQDSSRRKNEELVQALREKSRKHLQTQELYDKLKRRAMLGQVQNAASDAVDHNIQASVTANRYVDRLDEQNHHPPPPHFTNQQSMSLQNSGPPDDGRNMGPPSFRAGSSGGNDWAGYSSRESIQRMVSNIGGGFVLKLIILQKSTLSKLPLRIGNVSRLKTNLSLDLDLPTCSSMVLWEPQCLRNDHLLGSHSQTSVPMPVGALALLVMA